MDLVVAERWRDIFASVAEAKAEKRREEQIKLFYDDLDREKIKKQHATEKREKEAKQLEEAIATFAQLAAFDQDLDNYDTVTVHALMENGEALDQVRDHLRSMEENAYALPDGRRVFKTLDGQRVFDERGAEVSANTIDPQMIDDRHTRWETYKAGKDDKVRLEAERHDLLRFQAKVDDARSRAGGGDMTKKELDDLDADLKASAPPSIRQKLGLAAPDSDRDARLQAAGAALAQPAVLVSDGLRRAQPQPTPP